MQLAHILAATCHCQPWHECMGILQNATCRFSAVEYRTEVPVFAARDFSASFWTGGWCSIRTRRRCTAHICMAICGSRSRPARDSCRRRGGLLVS